MVSLGALTTNWLNFPVELRWIGASAPRSVTIGEFSAIFLGLSGAALGISELSSWERTAARSLRAGHVTWVLTVMLLSVAPLLLIPWGPARLDSPGIGDDQWISYAYWSILPYGIESVAVIALGLIITSYAGRFLGPALCLGVFLLVAVGQSLGLASPETSSVSLASRGTAALPWGMILLTTALGTWAAVCWRGRQISGFRQPR